MATFGFQWHVTDRCNRRCVHCYQSDFSSKSERSPVVLRVIAEEIFESMPDHRISVNITGGEPFAWPHLPGLLRQLHDYPNLAEVNVITNGTLATDELLDSLPHLTGGLVGEGDRQDAMRTDAADVDEVGRPVSDYPRLARPRAGDDEHGALDGLNGLPLGRIETG